MNDDYIIAIDENGQPYIAHAFNVRAAWGSVKGTAVKYKDKVKTKTGKWRYIYDEAVGNNAKRSAEIAEKNYWASKNKNGGKGEGSKSRHLKSVAEQQKAAYNKTLRGRAEKASKDLHKNKILAKAAIEKYKNTTLSAIKGTSGKAKDKVKDILGYDERERANRARDLANAGTVSKDVQSKREEAYKKALNDYSKTALGKYDKWTARRKVKKATKSSGSKTKSTSKANGGR